MKLMTLAFRRRRTRRRPRSRELVVESIEKRLAPSPTLPLPPPQAPSLVADALPQESTTANGIAPVAAHDQPPDPCRDQPPDPC
jgi:hypothetical protein